MAPFQYLVTMPIDLSLRASCGAARGPRSGLGIVASGVRLVLPLKRRLG